MFDRTPITPLLDVDDELEAYLCKHIANFRGQGSDLQSALGALVLGQHFGWRALRIMHSPKTIRKYDRVLGRKLKDLCPPDTHLADKLLGVRFANKIGAFWDVVTGRRTIANKGLADDEVEI
ncbi:MAG: hypothetical protein K0U72_05185 [Gammaproteobacteria bacterium]|nr:hypothetical protein [Gammaproteobacteria bacterium]